MHLERFWRHVPLLVAGCGLAATGCLEDFWPYHREGKRQSVVACTSTRRAPALDGGLSSDPRVIIDETDREVNVLDLTLDGTGNDFVGKVHATHGVGTVELGCQTLPVAVYAAVNAGSSRFFAALAMGRDRLYPLEFECSKGAPDLVRYESTDGTEVSAELLTGSCVEISATTRNRLRFAAVDMTLPRLLTGYTIEGPEISLGSDGRGSITLESTSYDLFAFNHFTYTTAEDTRELHILIRDDADRSVSFAALFLDEPGDPPDIRIAVTLPSLANEVGFPEFTATFTKP